MASCKHKVLSFTPSRHAAEAGYIRPSPHELLAATSTTAKTQAKPESGAGYSSSTFPAALVLPGDELSFDPDYDPQPAYECISNPHRNRLTNARRTVYVVSVPKIDGSARFVEEWAKPQSKGNAGVPKPKTADVLAYLQAFYYGVKVKLLESPKLAFVPWETTGRQKSTRARIGLHTGGGQLIGIRHRPSKDGLYTGQLNLNDLLDAAIAILPNDAYALLMLVDHDLYENESDDFCCGRAYGGSRVAVVSWARYNPLLDVAQEVETEHAWPASHCEAYMEDVCAAATTPEGRPSRKQPRLAKSKKAVAKKGDLGLVSAMHSAVAAYASLSSPSTPQDLSNLWLSRFCKTASHELGHCFGMDHCVYYACVMQGTSGLTEDAGQPPYLCPIDLVKTLHATGATEEEQYEALVRFCLRFPEDRMFRAFAAWLEVRLNCLGVGERR